MKALNVTPPSSFILFSTISPTLCPAEPPEAGLLAPPTNPNSGAAPSSSALSSSYKSLVGSHPEQETLLPAPRRGADKNQGGREAGGSGTNRQGNDGDLEAAEEVPAPVVEAPVRKVRPLNLRFVVNRTNRIHHDDNS